MPKARGSGSVGSGVGAGSIGSNGGLDEGSSAVNELANRLLDRLTQAGSVNVEIGSATRGEVENVIVTFDHNNEGIANVLSASGNTYVVNYNDDTCTCPNHIYRHSRCRHILAAHQAMGQIIGDSQVPQVNTGEAMTPQDIEEAVSIQQIADQHAEEQRSDIQQIEEDDEFFYSENDEAFQEALSRARTEELSYDYENALNGNNITFGLEIEFIGGNADAIARELYNMGICGYDRRVAYHSPSVHGKWKLERDGSVSNGSEGGELVSPVLTDTPETWRNLETICQVAKRHGAQINHKCGGHVHVGMEPLDTARQRWRRFFRAIAGFEDTIYRLAGGTEGQVRSGHSSYAAPFQNSASRNVTARFELNSVEDVNSLARNASHNNRFQGINLTNIYNREKPNTVELRYFNSSLDHRQLQANIKIAAGIMMASEKARTKDNIDANIFPSNAMKKRGTMLNENSMGSDERREHNGIRKFLDIMFTRKKDKDNILRVYAKNQWRN